jgi:hypothetical protein
VHNWNNIKDRYINRRAHLTFVFKQERIPGLILEFGVYKGGTINHIATLTDEPIWGFDSFEGLPEDWGFNDKIKRPKGEFAVDKLPEVASNIELVVGWFKDTLPKWKKDHKENIAFLHIDSDIYSSAVTILTELNNQIVPGTIIIFDELFNYQFWQAHEWKALNEWCEEYDREYEVLGRTRKYAASLRVIK